MPRKLTGTVYEASGKWYARVTIRGQRESILLPTCNDRKSAEARTALLAKFAERLREAKREDIALQLLDHAATLDNNKLDDVRRAVDLIVQGKVVRTREGNAGSAAILLRADLDATHSIEAGLSHYTDELPSVQLTTQAPLPTNALRLGYYTHVPDGYNWALIYDYRGVGGSAFESARDDDAIMSDWLTLDAPAAVRALRDGRPSVPFFAIS